MKRAREMSWSDYGISKHRYRELKEFCLQYDEKKKKIIYGNHSVDIGSGGSRGTYSPTEDRAIKNMLYKRDCELIEKAAEITGKGIEKYIIRSVTKDLPFESVEYDQKGRKIPMGRNEFYANRRKFYFILDCLKNGYNLAELSC